MENSISRQDAEKSKSPEETNVSSLDVEEGHTSDLFSITKDEELPRTFSPRQLQVINVGGTIGSGLFIVTGKALANGALAP